MKFFVILIFLLSNITNQQLLAQTNFWKKTDEKNLRNVSGNRQIIPDKYQVYTFDFEAFRKLIVSDNKRNSTDFIIEIPLPEEPTTFEMTETPVFDDELSKKYPGFTSFTGKGVEIPGATIKMSVSPFGINAMIMHDQWSTVFIDPYTQHNTTEYIVYYKNDFRKKTGNFTCGISQDHLGSEIKESINAQEMTSSGRAGDCVLRSYRLALACTGEYANFHGGTKEKVLAAFNNSMTRVNGVYEKEAAITMKLIGNTDQLIFLNGQTDPYTNSEGSIMLGENQTTINNIIGISNYDIGHVFSTAGGGIAQLRSPCTSSKARGVTGQVNPVGDPFDIDYVAHEMGHQFGANHTQNNSCQRNSSTAVEPGSASTIMGYAGICTPNVQNNSHANFHAISLGEIANFVVTGAGNTCPTKIEINNQKPTISVQKNSHTIPISTSFVLTALGEDADQDELTYCWEQMNSQTATMPPVNTSTVGPSFRALPPNTSPSRYFPDLQRRYTQWEVLPSVNRTMNFRCTVRDNNVLGGCTDEANVEVMTSNQAGPFVVTFPNASAVNWRVGSSQTVTWNVANTEKAPINCSSVNIYLSIDGGRSYPHLVAEKVSNTGSHNITTPALPTNMARIMVISDGNIFYDVSNANFRITTTFSIVPDITYIELCNQTRIDINFNLTIVDNATQNVTLSLENPPNGLQFTFSPQVVSLPGSATLSITNPQSLPNETTILSIVAAAGIEKVSTDIILFKALNTPVFVVNNYPSNFSTNISPDNITFEWSDIFGINQYDLEIASNPSFTENVLVHNVNENFFTTILQPGSIYYWRVKAVSLCRENDFGETFSFKTAGGNSQNAILLRNEVLLISSVETGVINNQKIDFASVDNDASNIIVTKLPTHGLLISNNIVLRVGDLISKTAINNNLFTYRHNGDIADDDSFTFDIIDELKRWLPGQVFDIKIRQTRIGVALFLDKGLLCFGDNRGSIRADGYGGTPPYEYSLDNVFYQSNAIFENLNSGPYRVYTKDAQNNIEISNSIIISSPPEIILDAVVDIYDIILNVSGGTGNLLYSLDDVTYSFVDVISDPGNGNYTIYIKDDNGCKVSSNVLIDITPISVTANIEKDVVCPGDFAAISAAVSGGVDPYQFSLNGLDFQTSPLFNVMGGDYIIYIRDAGNKIITTDTIKTTNPKDFAASLNQDGFEFVFRMSGGTPPYLFGRSINNLSPDSIFTFSGNGTFRIFVQDSKQCSYDFTLNINIFSSVSRTIRNASCYGLSNGFLRINPSNGSAPYLYKLNEGDFSSQREWNNLSAGEYTFSVIDSKSDTVSGNIVILQPDSVLFVLAVENSNLTITTTGGTPPYRHSLDGGDVFFGTNFFTELPLGTYNIVVKDDNNCLSASEVVTLSSVRDSNIYKKINIVPNPSNGFYKITSDLLIDPSVQLSVVDMLGRQVNIDYQIVGNNQEGNIHLIDAAPGLYLLMIYTNDTKVSELIIKL